MAPRPWHTGSRRSALPASVWTGTAYSLPLSLALTQTEGALWTLRRTRVQAAKGTSISPSGEDRRPFSCMPSSVPSHSSCQVLRLNRISHHCLRNKIPAQLTTDVFLSASSTGKTVHWDIWFLFFKEVKYLTTKPFLQRTLPEGKIKQVLNVY